MMNRRYMLLISGVMFFLVIQANDQQKAGSFLSQEENQRLETLFYLYENGKIESIEYKEISDIDIDIALIKKHATMMISHKNNAESAVYAQTIPTLYKSAAVCFCLVSCFGGLFVGSFGFFLCVTLYEHLIQRADSVVSSNRKKLEVLVKQSEDIKRDLDSTFLRFDLGGKSLKYLDQRDTLAVELDLEAADILIKQIQDINFLCARNFKKVFGYGVLALLSKLAAKMSWKASIKNKQFIKKAQKAYREDMAIILALKNMKYELANS